MAATGVLEAFACNGRVGSSPTIPTIFNSVLLFLESFRLNPNLHAFHIFLDTQPLLCNNGRVKNSSCLTQLFLFLENSK